MWIAVVLGLLFAAVLPIAALMNLQRYEAQAGIVYETEQETGTEPVSYTHLYRCPSCGQKVRVPRGKGRISIHCPKCQRDFIKRT